MDQHLADYFIGLDIGTSSAKAVAFSAAGRALAQTSGNYALQHPEPEAAVQDAEVIRQGVLRALRELIRQMGTPPRAIGLSGAMHSVVAVDQSGRPLSPLITWADGRAHRYAEQLRTTETGRLLYRQGGTPIHAMSPLCKLAWLREQQPSVFRRAAYFAGIKDYVLFHSFGKWLIDHSLASATGLFDLQRREWIPEALAYAGIDAGQLPQPVPCRYVLPEMPAGQARSLGLPPDTPWVIGGSDGALANLGSAVSRPGEAVLTIGTSGAIRMTVPQAVYDPLERLFCYILDETQYIIGGPTNNGGVVWEWFCHHFFPDCTMDEIFRQITTVPAGAEGLLFLPYLYGERAPVWDASARGHFWGIDAAHTRAHFARAVLEGICLNLRQISEALESVGGAIERIYANGGFIQSPVWVQLLADILGKEICVETNPHASAWGAAIMAMQATGSEMPSTERTPASTYTADQSRHRKYNEVFVRFKNIYPSARVS